MPTNPLHDACRFLLEPIVRLLVRNGVPWADFAEIAKQAYVKVARGDYGLQGRPTNDSRVAMMTGLSRREVGRVKQTLAAGGVPAPVAGSRISQILTGWHVDSEFLDPDGRPAELPADGERASLTALLRRYGGDLPHRALAKEMQQLGLVVEGASGFRVTARDYVRSAADPDMLRQASVSLHDHAATVVHNVDAGRSGPARFERMATHAAVTPEVAARFRELVARRGQELLEEVDAWLTEHATDGNDAGTRRELVRTGLGVYLIHDQAQEATDDE